MLTLHLVLGATGYAAQEAATLSTNKVNQDGGAVARQYSAQARMLLQQFRAELPKRGARGSVRTGTLYVPAAPIPT